MKTINQMISESKNKTYLTLLEFCELTVPIGMYIEYDRKMFNDVLDDFSDDEINTIKEFVYSNDAFDYGKNKILYSTVRKNPVICKYVEAILKSKDCSEASKKVLTDIKQNLGLSSANESSISESKEGKLSAFCYMDSDDGKIVHVWMGDGVIPDQSNIDEFCQKGTGRKAIDSITNCLLEDCIDFVKKNSEYVDHFIFDCIEDSKLLEKIIKYVK